MTSRIKLQHKDIFSVLFLLVLVCIVYRYILFSFFQQDEWVSLGLVLGGGLWAGLTQYPVLYYLAGYNRFFGTFLNNVFHITAPLNPAPFAVSGIVLHWMNSCAVYFLVRVLTGKRSMGIFAGVFFAVSTVHHQAITWFASTTTTLPSFFFAAISIILTLVGLKQQKTVFLLVSQSLMIVSFLFKESSIYIFPFLFFIFYYHNGVSRKTLTRGIKIYLPIIIYVMFILVIRFSIMFSPEGKIGSFITVEEKSIPRLSTQLIIYPLIGFSQTFIPSQFLESVATTITGNTENYKHVIVTMDKISISLSIVMIVFSFLIARKEKKRTSTLLFGTLLLFVSFIPMAVIRRDNTSYLDSRYYYLPGLGAVLLFAVWIEVMLLKILKKVTPYRLLATVFFFLLVTGYLYKQVSLTRAIILQNNVEGNERKEILAKFKEFFPRPVQKSVFLVEGDSLGYYGISEQKIPFQQGTGYTLMVNFYDTGMVHEKLLLDWFLWDMRAFGYKAIGDQGFGYFSSYPELLNVMKANKSISITNVYATYWYSSGKFLENTTDKVRKKLAEDLNENI